MPTQMLAPRAGLYWALWTCPPSFPNPTGPSFAVLNETIQ